MSSSRAIARMGLQPVTDCFLAVVVNSGPEVVEQLIEEQQPDPFPADHVGELFAVLSDVDEPAIGPIDLQHALEISSRGVQPGRPCSVEVVFVADHSYSHRGVSEIAGYLSPCELGDQPRDERALADAFIAEQQVEIADHDSVLPNPSRRRGTVEVGMPDAQATRVLLVVVLGQPNRGHRSTSTPPMLRAI